MYQLHDHPDIAHALRTGYPSCMQEGDEPEIDEDSLYDERRERELFEKE